MKLLFISLVDYKSLNETIHKYIIERFSKDFDEIFLFCLDKKRKVAVGNIIYLCGNLLDWFKFFIQLDKKDIKYVYASDIFIGGLFGVIFSRLLRKPLLLRCGGPWKYELDSLYKLFKTVLVKITTFVVINNSKKIVYNSKSIMPLKIKRKYSVVYNGVDTKFFRPMKVQKNSNKFNILFIGRICKEKGLEYLFNAVKLLDSKGYNVLVGVVGDGPLLSYYKKKYPFVTFYGAINKYEIPSYINSYDVLVLPTFVESFPNVLLEAMACGKPVIATNVWGIPELIKDSNNGLLVSQKSSLDIQKAVAKLINNKQLYKKLSINSIRIVKERFEMKKQMDKLYTALFCEK